MLRARRFSEKVIDHADLVVGPLISSIGYETIGASVALSARPEDAVLLSHRNHHYLAAKAANLSRLFAEIFGRDLGPQRGRAGSMHLASPEDRLLWSSAVIAGAVPLSVGAALGFQRQGAGVAFCAFGDGAMGEGVMSECLNFASLNKVPIVFICENNTPRPGTDDGGAYTTAPVEMMESAALKLTDIAASYQIATHDLDGSRPAETASGFQSIVDDVRRGDGPQFVEVATVLWPAVMNGLVPTKADGDTRLSDAKMPAAITSWAAADPVLQEVRGLLAAAVDFDTIAAIDSEAQAEVDEAARRAVAAPTPPPSVAFDDVWGAA